MANSNPLKALANNLGDKDAGEGPKMKYTRLGRSGLKISSIILGAMGFGSPNSTNGAWVLDEAASLPLLKYAFDNGINTWDTADAYSQGRSEEIIGKAITQYKIPREKLVLLTKCFFGVDEKEAMKDGRLNLAVAMVNDGVMVNRVGLSRKHIIDAVDASVKRLGTYIDVLQIHRLDKEVPPEEIMRALNDVVESGKVRYIGASSMTAWQFQMLNNVAEKHGWHKFISMQNYHNLLYREEEREMLPYCFHEGIGVIPWSPLAQGKLARPWNTSSHRQESDPYMGFFITPSDEAIVNKVEEIANQLGVSMAQVAMAWSLKKGVNPILGLQSEKRIDEAVGALEVVLSEDHVKALEGVYNVKPVAPVW
ncbi:Aldo/keto reductase [Bimuria novae-zelandiae CBS 107.79]|uniref:Aldo/keto reductase n=1 Tax=Bimuria novae-zelandiae CBS 107.79 TaxID=1447943 RepID=A0A6A5VFR1_9PLEO|nr:Aldo/keto reductase [Bimuria novae-zelandiae CBS 107.79]